MYTELEMEIQTDKYTTENKALLKRFQLPFQSFHESIHITDAQLRKITDEKLGKIREIYRIISSKMGLNRPLTKDLLYLKYAPIEKIDILLDALQKGSYNKLLTNLRANANADENDNDEEQIRNTFEFYVGKKNRMPIVVRPYTENRIENDSIEFTNTNSNTNTNA